MGRVFNIFHFFTKIVTLVMISLVFVPINILDFVWTRYIDVGESGREVNPN